MSRLVKRAEIWETVYNSFPNINFAAFDYNTIKQSLIDYIKLHFPEVFNDWIESSEFVAIIESFSYTAELLAYRLDVVAHENFLDTAQRQDSILRLAKLISYDPDRAIPNRGLVKITSISTTETIIDSLGNNLTGRTIYWNDATNTIWKDQFNLIMNRVLSQQFGTVLPSETFQLQGITFDSYSTTSTTANGPVIPFTVSVNGTGIDMELVSTIFDATAGILEKRPEVGASLTILFGQDGLGDGSPTTGFMCYTKQGKLSTTRQTFDGVTTNTTYVVPINNINNTDVWVNQVDPITGLTIDTGTSSAGKSGYWTQVDTTHSNNVIFNTEQIRTKFEIETRANNSIRLLFGDGEFSDIPAGTFDIWTRSSVDQTIVIPKSAITNKQVSLSYTDQFNKTQTLKFTISLVSALQNGAAAETLDHIKRVAPHVYYAQDRMVNGIDYNTYMLQDSSILKMRSMNRTFAGDSAYINWHDPSTSFDNVKIFGDDGAIYYDNKVVVTVTELTDPIGVVTNYIDPLLSSTDIFFSVSSAGVPYSSYSRTLSSDEVSALIDALSSPPTNPANVALYYNLVSNSWTIWPSTTVAPLPNQLIGWPNNYIPHPLITIVQSPQIIESQQFTYEITRYVNRLVFTSPTTRFWNTNGSNEVTDFYTILANKDTVRILQANTNNNRDGLVSDAWEFNVIGQETIDSGTNIGLIDYNKLSIIPTDINNDGVPDYLSPDDYNNGFPLGIANIMIPKFEVDLTDVVIPVTGRLVQLPVPYITGMGDVSVRFFDNTIAAMGTHWLEVTDTARYSTIDYNGTLLTTTPTGLLNDATVYNCSILLNQVLVILSIVGSTAQTVQTLINQIQLQITAHATIALVSGDLQITSNTNSIQSDVTIVDVGLFALLPGYVSVIVPAVHVVSNKILLTEFGGYNGVNNCTYPSQYWGLDYSDGSYITSLECIPVVTTITPHLGFNDNKVFIHVLDHVYLTKPTLSGDWKLEESTPSTFNRYLSELNTPTGLITRRLGRDRLNFAWFHITPRMHLTNPSQTNIIDSLILQQGYYIAFKDWINNNAVAPTPPTTFDLNISYDYLLRNKMISDTVILRPGKIKLLFGSRAVPELQATIVIIKSPISLLADNQIKQKVITLVREFFDITHWEFGETFYFSELSTWIHSSMASDVSSIVLVPVLPASRFGTMYQILASEDEIFYPDMSMNNISVVESYDDVVLKSAPESLIIHKVVYNLVQSNEPIDCEFNEPYCDIEFVDTTYIESLTCS